MDWTAREIKKQLSKANRRQRRTDASPAAETDFQLETLEPRILLSASPLVTPSTGTQSDTQDIAQAAIVQDAAPSVSAAVTTASVTGVVYSWNSHVELPNVTVSLAGPGTGTAITDANGSYSLTNLTTGSYNVTASSTADVPVNTISSRSALAALRIANGVDPNPTAGSGQLPLSPFQLLAADVDGDGRVTAADATGILQMAVQSPNAPSAKWEFVNETNTFYDPVAKALTINSSSVPTSLANSANVAGATTDNLVAVLTGDVLGGYVPRDGAGNPIANTPTLPASTFTTLSAQTGTPSYIWGVAPTPASTVALAAALANDTGSSATDGITRDATIAGTVSSTTAIVGLSGALDTTVATSYANLADTLTADGRFTLSQARLAALAGGTLADGAHTLHLTATDQNGNLAKLDLAFTLLTAGPAITALALSPASGSSADNTTSASNIALTGTTSSGSTVNVSGQSGLAGAGGTFQIGGVALADGVNTLVAVATDRAGNTSQRSIVVTKQGTLAPDQALIWNQAALTAIQALVIYPEDATRVLAMMSLAQYDTLAAVQGTPAYLVSRSVTGPISLDVALAAAADTVLDNLFPAQKAAFDALLATVAAGVVDGTAKTAALALGRDIGQTVYNIRATDGSTAFVDDSGSTVVGKWRPTGPNYLVAENPQWGGVTPFALTSGDEFRPAAPPDLTSAAYAAAVNEIESLGSATSTTRTADQTQAALFWNDGRGSATPPGHWVAIAEQVAQAKGNNLADNVRLFAQLNVALADSAIACWDAKYTYDGWRPQTAIQNADQDGNDATTADPSWTSLLISPPHPDYVSGHSTFSMAAATVLANTFGDNTSFTIGSTSLAGVSRSFTSFTQAALEAGRSRVYGGIHFEFSNEAGATLGQQVAAAVLTRFSLSSDTQPPTVVVPATQAVTRANLVLAGSIIDNISGVASAQVSIDRVAATALALDAAGRFSVTTAFATDGTADGAHSVTITTKDAAGNVAAPFVRSFTLDTRLPVLTLTSLADNDVLTGSSRLTGTADPTGSALVSLTMTVDGGKAAPMAFTASTGAFDQALPISNLSIGAHSLVLTAMDAAGNVGTLTRSVTVQALAAFTITGVGPADGSSDVGVTQRPQVFFSRAVNAATLTASSYYATGPDGSVLPTTIVPASDGSFAWLFFTNPMPGGSTVTIHVVGSSIRAAADGAFLDGDGDGAAGGTETFSFTTVSLASVMGTKLVGRVVDPGPDLVPMTLDDVKRGPDGILSTPDDVYLLPIAHAKVYILGREDQVVYTDANGLFELDDIPAGTVKVAIDGRTATNPPAGVFFPEMVMSADIKPGITNTLMGSVGSDASQAVNAGQQEVYLPRVPTSAFVAVSDTAVTTVTANQASAPGLSSDQVSSLSLSVPPGSAVGADGKVLTGVQIGIATVPPELVKDMLPPGVLQHTFDITIQAPGVSTFTTPVQITFPNVFNAAPGTKLDVLSFDHTTGKLVINGTATVSADGKTVVSDPDGGIKMPGWHGLVPPGTDGMGNVSVPCAIAGPGYAALAITENSLLSDAKGTFGLGTEAKNVLDAVNKGLTKYQPEISAKLANGSLAADSLAIKTATNLTKIAQFVGKAEKIFGVTTAISDGTSLYNDLARGEFNLDTLYDAVKFGVDVASFTPLGEEYKLGKFIFDQATGAFDAYRGKDFEDAEKNVGKSQQDYENAKQAFSRTGAWSSTPAQDAAVAADSNACNTDIANLKAALDTAQQSTSNINDALPSITNFLQNYDDSKPNGGFLQGDFENNINLIEKLYAAENSLENLPDILTLGDKLNVDSASLTRDVNSALFTATGSMMPGGQNSSMSTVSLGGTLYAVLESSDGATQRFSFNPSVGISHVLAPSTFYTLTVFDPISLYGGEISFVSSKSGSMTAMPDVPLLPQTDLPSNGGLNALAAHVVGVDPTEPSNLVPGITDITALKNGLTSAKVLPTGIISSVLMKGQAIAVAISGSADGAGQLSAYVAAGSAGVTIIDVSKTLKPTVTSQISILGNATGIAVDSTRNLAVVADGGTGLEIIDVSAPAAPRITQTVALPNPATRVALQDGIAYVTTGTAISTVDITTGEVRQTLDLKGGTLTDIAFSGGALFVLDSSRVLTALTISGDLITKRGTITLAAAAGTITAAGTTIYVGAYNGFSGGFETVDASNPDKLTLLSGVDANNLGGGAMALNGSGLALALAPLRGPQGQAVNGLDVVNVADPTDTSKFITRITLPATPNDVAIANGIAFVADGTGGLQIVNYLGFDTKGISPKVSITTDAIDADPKTDGVQVVEGSTLHITPTVTDDVQVRNVELLVNGQVVANDPSYPFDFSVAVPTIASGGKTVTIQVRATDTGGNVGLSALTTLNVVPDTFPPTVISTSLAEGARVFFVRSVQVTFSEPIDPAKLAASGISLVGKGADGKLGTADDVTISVTTDTRGGGQVLSIIPSSYLLPGNYQLTLSPSVITDRAGNALAAPVTLNFTIRPASDIRATTGIPAIAAAPSANPGQTIALPVPFDPTTAYATFAVIADNGTVSTRDVKQVRADTVKGVAYFTVPADANTGDVVVYSLVGTTKTSFTDGTFFLQVLPVVSSLVVQSVASDGSSASVQLTGSGFIEGAGSYAFGLTTIADTSTSQGPAVGTTYQNGYVANGSVTLTVPLSDGAFGPVVVTTSGGSSAAYVASVSSITAVALSGTPSNAALASANPGQAVTLNGAGLSTATAVLFHYMDNAGTARTVVLTPVSASGNGTQATVVVPGNANGVGKLQVFGSASEPVLQIVPLLTGFSATSTTTLTLTGAGFVEGGTTYKLPGATIADTVANAGADVTYGYIGSTYTENAGVNIPVTTYGAGSVTVTTAGGTSAALALNVSDLGLGYLRDVGLDQASGAVWVVDNASPTKLDRVDLATGATLSSVTLTSAGFGSTTTGGAGLQVVPSAFTLNGTSVPAGSLLLFNAGTNPDRVTAVNPANGNVIASLTLAQNYGTTGGAYDKVTGHLFLLDQRTSPTAVVEINPANGAQLSTFNLPFNAGEDGLTVNPVTGNLWYGTDSASNVVELSKTGTVLRTVDLGLQGVPANTATGLAFDANGTTLLVSTTQGLVFKVDLTLDPAAQSLATLTALTSVASDGTPANAAQASANVGQVVTLTGSNFGAGTEVMFTTRDNAGNTGLVRQFPLAVNPAGTQLQVVVPNLAASGLVRVVNTGAQNLGFNSYNDAIYRRVTLSYTPTAANSVVTFADLGLEVLSNESWGLDNVLVRQNGAAVFQDNFEGGAKANWSNPATDATVPGVFSQFSGRFNNGAQALSLTGLTPGQAVTLSFDLYVLDSWEGGSTSYGPDLFQVSADGATLMRDTFTNIASLYSDSTQSYGASAGIRLQIVPTLTATGQPGTDTAFTLTGSGFQDGASTITVGGVALVDGLSGQAQFAVSGTRNDTYRIDAPLTLDGPVTVTTDGGSASVAGPVVAAQPPALFTAIQANAAAGAAADGTKPSANVGQAITLVGQGFTNSTLVRFAGVDDTGAAGTITRTGSANSAGTALTVVVPELARTGAVTVPGSGTSLVLQVVPVLRGVGGTVAAGGQVLLDGSGLVGPELTVLVDGRGAGTFAVKTVADVNAYDPSNPQEGQQLLSLTVPAGASAGVITVSTAGGSFTVHAGVAVAASSQTPAADVGDTLATAQALGLVADSRITVSAKTNDGAAAAGLDVDLYKVTLAAGDQLSISLTGASYSHVRLLDATGAEITRQQFNPSGSAPLVVTAPASGTYYVGVSGYGNLTYKPTIAGSGTASGYTGAYQLTLERLGSGDARLSGISAAATYGTAARGGVASANVGQTITLSGTGLVTGETLLFSAIDLSGNRYWSSVVAASVAADGTSLTAVVPVDATTGTVRLARDPGGVVLQVVPHLTHIDANAGQVYNGSTLTITGSGFAEGASTVQFGATSLPDSSRNDGLDVSYQYAVSSANNTIYLTVPAGVPTGPIRVVTTGGTSDQAGPVFTGITATASSGTPAASTTPSAVPGQTITITGSGFDAKTDVVFPTADANGARSQVLVQPATVNATGTIATLVVPLNAITGAVRVVGDQNAASAMLQVLPVVTSLIVQSVASDGSNAVVQLIGSGFVEGAANYVFGSTVVPDTSTSQGPSVGTTYQNGYVANGSVTLTVPLSDGAFGPVVVTTSGGSSAAYVASVSSITAVALSGTPSNAALASANPGQAVTLNGAGLSTSTSVLFHYMDNAGTARTVVLTPVSASGNGTQATVVVPGNANGVGKLQVFGSASEPVLQIVPLLTGFSATSTTTLTLTGAGFVEGGTTYKLPGATIADTVANAGADVTYGYIGSTYTENAGVNIPVTTYGAGSVTVTTAGGTSAALALNVSDLGLGYLRDVGLDQASGAVWVVDNASPTKLDRVDLATGATLSSVTLTSAGFGSTTTGGAGLQVVPSAFTLNGTSVPAGSLLLFNAGTNPDRVTAVNPANGNVIASLTLAQNYGTTGGAYDKVTGHLFLLDQRTSPTAVVEINPANGAQLSTFNLPFNAGEDGLTVNPVTGNLWYGTDSASNVVELSKTGTVLRTVDLGLQGVPANTATGLAFDANGTTLLVSTTQGLVFKVDLTLDPAAQSLATLTALTSVASDGTPANAAQASANVGQVVTLTGSNFGAGTEVMFTTRDNAGNTGLVRQFPLAVNPAGTQLQVVVPNLAASGLVRVVNTGAENLGFNSYNDAIYRRVTLSYTPAAANSVVTFADLGLEVLSNESWGLDNVLVRQNGAAVFQDNFEGGAKANWSNSATDATVPGVFSQFSGRFNNGAQALSLTGLTPGQAVTLSFDLYVLDSWEGGGTSYGPDLFQVSADGATLMRDTFTNIASLYSDSTQSYGASAGIRLQIVPTLTATGQPGTDTAFTLTGSGFQDGASTITVGGVALVDGLSGQAQFAVSGTRNDTYRIDAPLTLDGPVTVTTDGGSASVAGPVMAAQPPALFTAIQANAAAGAAADGTKPSANVGQAITLVGQGFTNSTLVRFAGVDDTGAAGTITRTGSANSAGTALTVVVPELARTGAVTVPGSGTSLVLQVVPVLRGVGGTVAAGGQVLLDGSGLVGPELTVLVDGRGAGTFAVKTVADVNAYDPSNPQEGQQLLSLTVPAGASAGVITVSTAGGSFTVHAGVAVAASSQTPAADVGDTLATAQALGLVADSRITVSAKTNDGAAAAGLDVDLYKVTLAAGDQLSISLTGASYSHVRLLDATGAEITRQQFNPSGSAPLVVTAPASGTYYVGVSGYGNLTYKPTIAGSGTASGYTGAYQLTLERLGSGDARLSGISAAATYGTAARGGVASANVGQTITLSGTGLVTGETLLFSAIDLSGNRYWSSVVAASVAADGTSLTAVVPVDATTGTVRLARDPGGVVLQVVPHLTHIDANAGQVYNGSTLTITGSGFAEGASTVQFGATSLPDSSRNDGLDVSYQYAVSSANNTIYLTVPAGVPTGPIRVVTAGGTSDQAGPAFTGLTATASSGTPATSTTPSAVPGQTITITGSGFDAKTDVVFPTADANGARSQVLVQPATVNAAGTIATLVVPLNAITGAVRVVGDQNAASITLQIVPLLTGFTANSNSGLTLNGAGFVEGSTIYKLPGATIADTSVSAGVDVTYGYVGPTYTDNATANIPVTTYGAGSVTVTTAGGTSAALALNVLNPGLGYLRDVAVDQTSGAVWVVDNASPTKLDRLDPATGATLSSITLTSAGFGTTTTGGAGLQVVPSAFTLNGASVPAGSLLLFNAGPNPDRVIAVNPANGNVIASLALTQNYDTTGGAYDKTTGHLFLLNRQPSTDAVVEINPATGAQLSTFNLPFNAGEAGLAVNPVTGNLWYGSDNSGNMVELSKTGTVLRTVSLGLQNVPANTETGLAFDAAGTTLFVSTSQGLVFKATV